MFSACLSVRSHKLVYEPVRPLCGKMGLSVQPHKPKFFCVFLGARRHSEASQQNTVVKKFTFGFSTIRAKLSCLCIICPLGQVKFSSDRYIMAIFLSWASMNFCYFHTPLFRHHKRKKYMGYILWKNLSSSKFRVHNQQGCGNRKKIILAQGQVNCHIRHLSIESFTCPILKNR